ncbi:hypothetical protein [Sphingomonas crocodyli]|uniref:Uncharacterized protein n=1 Tax=Sphingomonas crocodyli TaxID=1979270 RepID=A0A437M043_9SPHN|nr:hypothetical protein [Sphingomonas crocodyli]RVT91018.1 hypothetical protein EOD43_15925 [Sphingomonas crocodyli]
MLKLKTQAILLAAIAPMVFLAGCKSGMDFDETGGVKIARSACPAVAIATYTGDITTFTSPAQRTVGAIDVSASIANLQTSCTGESDPIGVTANFDVLATRAAPGPARQVTLPWFATLIRAGNDIQSKQTGQVVVTFADGATRGTGHASVTGSVSRALATLPPEVLQRITRKRKVGDADAALDPLTDPTIRDAVLKANFEMLVGFQLSEEQLAYNATR